MKTDHTKNFLNKMVVRIAPSAYVDIGNEEELFNKIRSDEAFQKALYHANLFVYTRAMEWFAGTLTDRKNVAKIKHTLYNYYTRWYTTTVPYGFFSSVGTAAWRQNETNIELASFRQSYRLDMDVISKLSLLATGIHSIRYNILYYPNNTVYQAGDYLRFLEATEEGSKLSYKISAVEHNEIITTIMQLAHEGRTISALASALANEDYSQQELEEFIDELVNAQLLMPQTRLNISGPDAFTRLCETIGNLNLEGDSEWQHIIALFESIKKILSKFSDSNSDFLKLFNQLKNIIEAGGIAVNEKFLLQVDNFSELSQNSIDHNIAAHLYEALTAMSCFNQNNFKPFIETFKKKFTERYEDASIPLLQVIDSESGIGFGDISFQNDSVLLSELNFEEQAGDYLLHSAKGDALRTLLYKRYYEALKENKSEIRFYKEDFADKDPKVAELAANFQIIFSVIDKEQNLLHLRTAGNSSGADLISRFAYASPVINGMIDEITAFEQAYYGDAVIAEIVHISDYRIGNITFRPFMRQYEIPVFTNSVRPPEEQLPLSDLMVTVREGKVVVWSKKLGKRVIPMLTNAHNYHRETTPVYQFLSEISYQNTLPSLFIDRAETTIVGNYVPRIQYENVVLYPATWRFDASELAELTNAMEELTPALLEKFKTKWNLPRKTALVDGGSNVLVDWTSTVSVYYFLKTVLNKRGIVFLEEFLFNPEKALVTDQQGRAYISECITMVNNVLKTPDTTGPGIRPAQTNLQTKYHAGQEWLYFKIYCGVVTGDKLMSNDIATLVQTLFDRDLISKFFFIRYNDPEYHLRLRFKTLPHHTGDVINLFNNSMADFINNDIIWKVQLDTYVREVQRYGYETIDFAESVFDADSKFVMELLPLIRESYAQHSPFLFMKGVDTMLNAFGFSAKEKHRFIEDRKKAYEGEFNVEKSLNVKQSIAKKDQSYRRLILHVLEGSYERMSDSLNTNGITTATGNFHERLVHVFEQYKHLLTDKNKLWSLCASLVHMHAIRMFQTKPRYNELVAYSLLCTAYATQLKTTQVNLT